MKNLSIIEYLLSDDDPIFMGVSAVSLVFNPANKSHAVAASNSESTLFVPTDNAERIIKGLFIRANTPFKQKYGGGKMSKISADTIKKMRDRFHSSGADKKVTINHEKEDGLPVYQDDCHVVESYIVKNNHDVQSLNEQGIIDAAVGDWVLGVKVSEDVWNNDVQSGDIRGLSFEADHLRYRPVAASEFDIQMAKAERLAERLFKDY